MEMAIATPVFHAIALLSLFACLVTVWGLEAESGQTGIQNYPHCCRSEIGAFCFLNCARMNIEQ